MELDTIIEYNNYFNLERVVSVPFIFLDELIEQISTNNDEDSKNTKQIYGALTSALKDLLDLQLLEEPIPKKQIKIINARYIEAMKEVRRRLRKTTTTVDDLSPLWVRFWHGSNSSTTTTSDETTSHSNEETVNSPDFYSPYVRDLLSCYYSNWKVVLDKNLK